MLQEQDLIPYHPSDLPPSPWLILSPHPDDETIGMGGTILLASKQDIKIFVAVVTKGELYGDEEERKKEFIEAAKFLGISEWFFFDLPDRNISSGEFIKKFNEIIKKVAPKTVFLPSPLEFHPDHRKILLYTWTELKQQDFKGEIWLYEISRQGEVNKLIDISKSATDKIKAIKFFKSQIKKHPFHEIALALNRSRSLTLPSHVQYAEGFWKLEKDQTPFILLRRENYLSSLPLSFPLVSIIIRTKNRPYLLKEALQSIADQTYPYIEAVVVNDGGQDVEFIIEEFKGKIYSTQYISQPSKGRSAAANTGLSNSRGEWIGFLDDDDIYLPNGVADLLIAGLKNNLPVYGKTRVYDGDNQKYLYDIGSPFILDKLFLSNYIPLISFLAPKKIIEKVEPFDENFFIFEDWDWLYRLGKICTFNYLEKDVAVYRIFGQATITGRHGNRAHEKARRQFYLKHFSDFNIDMLINMEKFRLELMWEVNDLKKVLKEKDAKIGELKKKNLFFHIRKLF